MKIHLSTATVHAHENRRKSMNIHFHPIVMFEESWPFPTSYLKEISWKIYAEPIGTHKFDVELSVGSPFEVREDKNYIEFHLSKSCVPFQYDDYECEITFSAILESPHTFQSIIEHTFWGVVKTTWSKGLN